MCLPVLVACFVMLVGQSMLVSAQPSAKAKGHALSNNMTLENLRGKSRPLLVFASRPDDPQMELQLRTLRENAPGVAERDITVIALPYKNPSPTAANLTSRNADAIRRRFGIAPGDFAVILVGKDGGEKLRSTRPICFEQLRDTIDAMPMRQDEMR